MEDISLKHMGLRSVLTHFSYTVVFCTIIALFLTLIDNDKAFLECFIISQFIGLCACTCSMLGFHVIRPQNNIIMLIVIIVALFIGTSIGAPLGFLAAGIDLPVLFGGKFFLSVLTISILFGSVITYFFLSQGVISSKEALIQEERVKRLNIEKKAVETNLRLLQAQIEPHFLFNTLSNILSLLNTDLEKGKSMLVDLMQYLRTTLSKTRGDTTTVGEEMEIIKAYLNIYKIRMGDRLRYRIDIPDSLRDFPFQPMLIQPLVENAVRHGLEPEVEGGEILIRGAVYEDTFRLEIMDTGAGLYENSNPGMGIDNTRERLKSLYGDKGRLILEENQPSGLKAIIEVPYEPDKGDHR